MKPKILAGLAVVFGLAVTSVMVVRLNASSDPKLEVKVPTSEDVQTSIPGSNGADDVAPLVEKNNQVEISDGLPREDSLFSPDSLAVDVYSKLFALADSGNPQAALKVVEISERCSLAKSSENLDGLIMSIGQALLEDTDGRRSFNQSLIFRGLPSKAEFEDLQTYVQDSQSICAGFDQDELDQKSYFDLLMLAAQGGSVEAKIAIWSVPNPSYSANRIANHKNPGNLDYLRNVSEERQLGRTKVQFLEEAAAAGDPRALILLGDAYSSERWVDPDLRTAYAYYLAAAEKYDYPFIYSRLDDIRFSLSEEEAEYAENLAHRFN